AQKPSLLIRRVRLWPKERRSWIFVINKISSNNATKKFTRVSCKRSRLVAMISYNRAYIRIRLQRWVSRTNGKLSCFGMHRETYYITRYPGNVIALQPFVIDQRIVVKK